MTQLPPQAKKSYNKSIPSIALSGQRSIVLLLALLATAAVTLVRIDANWTPWTIVAPVIFSSLLAIGLMMLGLRNIGANAKVSASTGIGKPNPTTAPTSETRSRTLNQRYIFLTAVLILFPFVANSLVKIFFGLAGEPFELLMLATVQQGAIAAVTLHNTRKSEWISGLLSFFLFVFCVTISGDIAVYILAGIFALLGIWWLMGAYWERIQSGFVAQQSVPIVRLRFGILSAVIGVLLILGYLGTHPSLATYALNGFMPTSGGNGEADDTARSGIGDGEQMVAAQDTAMSFGPVESELFLEDTAPSLYDMFSEFYGQDAKIKKNIERAISLNQTEMQQQHQHLSQSQKSSREFSAVRKSTPRLKQQPKGTQSPALIYLIGATPAHLAMETFDAFDGKNWTHQQPSSTVKPQLIYQKDKPWVQFSLYESIPYRVTQHQYGIKIINLKSSRIPSPDLVNSVHIDKVDRPDFYGLTNDGIPQLVGRDYTPQLTVLKLQNTFPHLHQLRKTSYFKKHASAVRDTAIATDPASVQERNKSFDVVADPPMDAPLPHPPSPALEPMPTTSQGPVEASSSKPLDPFLLQPSGPTDSLYEVALDLDEIASLSKQWTAGVPRGWLQVEMIVDTLRRDFQHDPVATAPENCTNVVNHFLKTKKGPDYLFATTAAMMLRTLGYPTRLTTGLYADPKNFEYRNGQTIVRKEDLHTWTQVSIDGIHWISIEPTPGFKKPIEVLNWFEWSEIAFWKTLRWIYRNPLIVLLIAVCMSWCAWSRIWLFERTLTFIAAIAGSMSSLRNQVLWTIWLLQWRGKIYGAPRAVDQTLRSWLTTMAKESKNGLADIVAAFVPQVEKLWYAPKQNLGSINEAELRRLCERLIWNPPNPFKVHSATNLNPFKLIFTK